MPLRDVCFYFSGDIKPPKMRILIAQLILGSSTIWFRLLPSQSIGHCPGVGSLVEYFSLSSQFQVFRWAENGASR